MYILMEYVLLLQSVMSPWIHGGDPISMTRINEHVERFKVSPLINNPLFNNNPHCLLPSTGELEDRGLLAGEDQTTLSQQQPSSHIGHVPTSTLVHMVQL